MRWVELTSIPFQCVCVRVMSLRRGIRVTNRIKSNQKKPHCANIWIWDENARCERIFNELTMTFFSAFWHNIMKSCSIYTFSGHTYTNTQANSRFRCGVVCAANDKNKSENYSSDLHYKEIISGPIGKLKRWARAKRGTINDWHRLYRLPFPDLPSHSILSQYMCRIIAECKRTNFTLIWNMRILISKVDGKSIATAKQSASIAANGN